MKITVFGGSNPKPGEKPYQEALELGQLLGKAGYEVLNGGYMGTMEAVSRGAAEAGGHVIGVTCREIETWRDTKANKWVQEEWQNDTLRQRLDLLIHKCDGALALPGGAGTLVEICLTWDQMIIHTFDPKPLIVIGEGWKATFDTLFDSLGAYIPQSYRTWLHFVPDIHSAVALLKEMLK
ncbi:MAG: LOG family protein [Chloroflexota bacterium]